MRRNNFRRLSASYRRNGSSFNLINRRRRRCQFQLRSLERVAPTTQRFLHSVAGSSAGNFSRAANLSQGGECSWPIEPFCWFATVFGFPSAGWQLVLAVWHRSVSGVLVGNTLESYHVKPPLTRYRSDLEQDPNFS